MNTEKSFSEIVETVFKEEKRKSYEEGIELAWSTAIKVLRDNDFVAASRMLSGEMPSCLLPQR